MDEYTFVGILQPNPLVLFSSYTIAITHLHPIAKADITSLSTNEAASLTRTVLVLAEQHSRKHVLTLYIVLFFGIAVWSSTSLKTL